LALPLNHSDFIICIMSHVITFTNPTYVLFPPPPGTAGAAPLPRVPPGAHGAAAATRRPVGAALPLRLHDGAGALLPAQGEPAALRLQGAEGHPAGRLRQYPATAATTTPQLLRRDTPPTPPPPPPPPSSAVAHHIPSMRTIVMTAPFIVWHTFW